MKTLMLSIIVPVLNEERNIRALYSRVSDVFKSLGQEFELLFVDDGSQDRTYQEISALHQRDVRVKAVSFSRNFGHQAAISAGLDLCEGDAAIVMDGDLQHPPELIGQMIDAWKNGYEIVYTVRSSTADAGALKTLTSTAFYRLFNRLSQLDLPQGAADFRLLDRKVVLAFRQIRERNRFMRGLTSWVGYRSLGIPYKAAERNEGRSKYTFGKMLRFALEGITSFSTFPLRMAIYLGFVLSAAGLCYAAYVLYIKLFAGHAVPGWASIAVLVAIIGGIQLVVSGIIGLYIGKIYQEVKQRPLYLIRDSLGLKHEGPAR